MNLNKMTLDGLKDAVRGLKPEDLDEANRQANLAVEEARHKLRAVGHEISRRSRLEQLHRILSRMSLGQREVLLAELTARGLGKSDGDQDVMVEGIKSEEAFGQTGAKIINVGEPAKPNA